MKTIEQRFIEAVIAADQRTEHLGAFGSTSYAAEFLAPEMLTRGLVVVDTEELDEVMGHKVERDRALAERDEVGVQLVAAQKWIQDRQVIIDRLLHALVSTRTFILDDGPCWCESAAGGHRPACTNARETMRAAKGGA